MSDRWAALVQHRRAEYRGTGRVLNIAHRGASGHAPENSIEAIEKAAVLGADMVEVDVHLSADGQLVVTHDLDEGLTLDRIQRLNPRIPSLPACLACARDLSLLVNVEIKNDQRYAGIEERVTRAIEEAGLVGRTLISCFDHHALTVVRRLNGAVATAALSEERLPGGVDDLMALDADAWHPRRNASDRSQISMIRAAGHGLNVWTVNDPEHMRELLAAGVTGIFTDYPDRLRTLLDDGDWRSDER